MNKQIVDDFSTALLNMGLEHIYVLEAGLMDDYPFLDGVYLGFSDGSFSGFWGWEPDPDWDSTTRPWYIDAVAARGATVITKPYVSRATEGLVTAVARDLGDVNGLNVVMATDIHLWYIMDLIGQIDVVGGGYMFLIAETGEILTHPEPTLLPTLYEFHNISAIIGYAELLDRFIAGEDVIRHVNYYGVPSYFISHVLSAVGWRLITVIPAVAVSAPLWRTLWAVMLTIVLVLAVVMTFSFIFLKRTFVNPLEVREELLSIGYQAAKTLLKPDASDGMDTLMQGAEIIGNFLGVDRAQIWNRDTIDGELVYILKYEWVSELGSKKKDYPVGFYFPYSAASDWFDEITQEKKINCLVSDLHPAIKESYKDYGVLSTAIVPIFIEGELFGFFSVQDYKREYVFNSYEMELIESASLMLNSVFNRLEQDANLVYRQKLLQTVNQVALALLSVENDWEIEDALADSMKMMGQCINADGIHLLRCGMESDGIVMKLASKWISEIGQQTPQVELNGRLPLGVFHAFEEILFNGQSINGAVANLPAPEQNFLNPEGTMKSIAILPLFMNGELWGFLSMDDCVNERTLSENEMAIMHSAGLMLVNVFSRFAQKELAFTDALTGVRNRRYFEETAERELQNCIKDEREFAVIMTDIDHFKSVNDRFGHTVGDEVLKIFTARIKHILKQNTLFARYGGEEFVIVLSDTSHEDAMHIAWRLNKAVQDSLFQTDDLEIKVSASFGVATKTSGCKTLLEIVGNADKALYQAKKSGRNTVIGFSA
jgi:diguanylate cyclase (GGDEF)-like protein